MRIIIDDDIIIELINKSHAQSIFEMVDVNRIHLRRWLTFVDKMQTVEFAENFVKGTEHHNSEGNEYAFVIIANEKVVGRVGVYKIDAQNKIGEIGYWIVENMQGKGIVIRCCQALINFCFVDLQLNRIEIKCGTENHKSKSIPEKLNFSREGIIRQGEWVYDKFIDLHLYSLLKSDFIK